MIKHAALLGILVVLLVSGLLYTISPDEVLIVYSMARNRMSTQASEVISETLYRGTHVIEQVRAQPAPAPVARNIRPDPFHPFRPREATAAKRFLTWLRGPQAIMVWLSMLAGCLAGRLFKRRRFEFALEERMAITLSKAVRQL